MITLYSPSHILRLNSAILLEKEVRCIKNHDDVSEPLDDQTGCQPTIVGKTKNSTINTQTVPEQTSNH